MAKRVFIALKISEGLRQKILDWKKTRENLSVRWHQGKNLHITLIPPWYTDDIDGIKKTLEELRGQIKTFRLFFDTVTFGPNHKETRFIWAEGTTPPQLIELKTLLENHLHQKPQRPGFKLHITLARFSSVEFQALEVKKLDEKVDWEENVHAIVLMESRLSPRGSDYEILHEIPL